MPRERRILTAATVVHAALGIVIATAVTGPILAIDDLAFLSMGYTLSGEGAAPLAGQPPYGFLYPVLLVPGWFFGLAESQMLIYAQVLNALLGAALLPVLFALVRRLTNAPFVQALTAAAVGSALPAALLTSNIAWTETLLPLLVAASVLALLRLRDESSSARIATVIALALAMYATHPRMIVAAILVLVAGALATARWPFRGVFASGLIGLRLVEYLRVQIAEATFGSGGNYDAGDLASRRGLGDITDMAVRGGGTIAYLLLATAGLAALGAIVFVKKTPIAAVVYGTITASIVAVAGWFLTGVDRSDAFLHGRYIEVIAPLLVALGVVAARELPRRISLTVVTSAVVFAGIYAAWAGPGDNWGGGRSPVMMLGTEVSGAPFGGTFFEPGAAASTALIVGLAIVFAARFRPFAPLVIVGLALALAIPSGIAALDSLQENSVVGVVQAALVDEQIELIVIDAELVPANVAAAVAWEVGFDHSTETLEIGTTHLLLATDASAPSGARLVADLGDGSIWALE